MYLRVINWFCGFDDGEKAKKEKEELAKHLDETASLEQSKSQKIILYINLAIILAVAVGMYVYFCINPFTKEEIDALREKVAQRTVPK